MKTAWLLLPLLIAGWVLSGFAEPVRPSHELLMPYSSHWRAEDFSTRDLLSLLRCDLVRWRGRETAASPATLGGFTVAYDLKSEHMLMFYGADELGLNLVSETWEWDGSSWTKVSEEGPPGRVNQAMVYDASSQTVLLFGGQGGGSFTTLFGDSWVWDGSAWAELQPASHPSARAGHALAFDASRGEAILFGGDGTDSLDMQGPYFNETWGWDGANWELKAPADSPSPRFRHAMAYDAVRKKVVLFGGNGEDGPLDDTWEWDGSNWSRITTSHRPDNRRGHGMAYDTRRGKVVLYGGELGYGFSTETWEYDGVDWTRVEAADSPETDAVALTYDAKRGEIVLFTGEAPYGTYVYDGEPSCPE